MIRNFIDGKPAEVRSTPNHAERFLVLNPANGTILSDFGPSHSDVIHCAVGAARCAMKRWSQVTPKQRAQTLQKFRNLCLDKYQEELVSSIVQENGKHRTDATASLLKGIETCEYALSPTSIGYGCIQEVSTGITCRDRRDPVGVVVSICPFNFPAMVPMWTVPILVACGNCVIIKPSEKTPLTVTRMVEIMHEAGLPPGVVQVLQGGRSVVDELIQHPGVDAVTFVGSSPVAEIVYRKAIEANKRALCLGGAKNHLVVMPDADPEQSSTDVLNSFAGSAGQRCMAAYVLLVIESEKTDFILSRLVEKARAVIPGQTEPGQMGPVIDQAALDRITRYILNSESRFGGRLLVDGREWTKSHSANGGFWIGPTIIEHHPINELDPALCEEIFGPVVSVIRVKTLEEAIARINRSPYGNAACIYTQSGYAAELFTKSVDPGMVGVNIGVPVPREPFSFGGTKRSKFGIGDITGDGLVEFGTIRRKITTKWSSSSAADFVAKNFTG